jgi:hypothetical protein
LGERRGEEERSGEERRGEEKRRGNRAWKMSPADVET